MTYIGTPQERWQWVVDKERQRLKKNGKLVVHVSREPDYDSHCCIEEYESYCEKFNMQAEFHVGSMWQGGYDNIGDEQEFHFIFISEELDKLVKAQIRHEMGEAKRWEAFREENGLVKDDGIVYFLLFPESSLVKIGFTTSIDKRLAAYRTHCAEEFKLIKIIPGSRFKEKVIHGDLKLYRTKKEFFEWNTTTQSLINEYD